MIIIIKPTNSCNANCVYCSAHDTDPNQGTIPLETVETTFSKFAEYLQEHPDDGVVWTWHGGEPLLAGKKFFRSVLTLQEQYFPDNGNRVRNLIQTNLTLLDEEWVDILFELCGTSGIGTSYDPIPGIRPLKNNKSYEKTWNYAVKMLEKRRMRFGIGYVVHSEALGRERELYNYFTNFDRNISVRFNPLYEMGRGSQDVSVPYRVNPIEYGKFLIRMFDCWESGGRAHKILPISEWVDHIEGKKLRLTCESSGRCSETHIGIGPDGRVFCCGRGHDAHAVYYGDIKSDTINAIMERRNESEITSRFETLRNSECRDCDLWQWCHGGCPIDGLAHSGDVRSKTHWCESRKIFARHYQKRAEKSVGMKNQNIRKTRLQHSIKYQIRVAFSGLDALLDSQFGKSARHEIVVEICNRKEYEDFIRRKKNTAGHNWSIMLPDVAIIEEIPEAKEAILIDCTQSKNKLKKLLYGIKNEKSKPRYILDAASSDICDTTLMLASLGSQVTLQFGRTEKIDYEEMSRVLDYYLHTPSLKVPIDPIHGLVTSSMKNNPMDIWTASMENHLRNLYVDNLGRVTLSKRFGDAGLFYGNIEGGMAAWRESELFESLENLVMKHRVAASDCSTCTGFSICKGFFRYQLVEGEQRDCNRALEFLSDIEDATKLAGAILEGSDENSRRVDR